MQTTVQRTAEIGQLIDERPLSGLQIRIMILCSLVVLLDGYDIQTLALAVPSIAADWSITANRFGLALTSAIVGMGVSSAFLAPLGDRIGRKPMIIGFMVLVGIASLATAAASSLTDFVIWRFIMGIGMGASLANATALTSEIVPARRRTLLVALMFCNVPVGAFLASFTAPGLIETFGWRGLFVVGGVLPLLLCVILVLWSSESIRFLLVKRPEDRRVASILTQLAPGLDASAVYAADREPVKSQSVLELLSPFYRSRTLLLWSVFCLNLFVLYLLISWLPTQLRGARWSNSQAMRGAGMIQLGGVIGGLLVSWYSDRGKTVGALVCAYSVASVALASFLVVPSETTSWGTLILLLGAGISGAQLALYALAAAFYPPAIRATGLGWVAAVSRVGAMSGPLVGGMVLLGLGTTGVLGALIVPTILCALCVLLLPRVIRAL